MSQLVAVCHLYTLSAVLYLVCGLWNHALLDAAHSWKKCILIPFEGNVSSYIILNGVIYPLKKIILGFHKIWNCGPSYNFPQ